MDENQDKQQTSTDVRAKPRAWAAFAAGVVGLFAGLALDRALFWTDNSFTILLALPTGLLAAGLCYWAMPLVSRSR